MTGNDCKHPREQRSETGDGRVRCGKCGRTFLPRGRAPLHGTYNGYGYHSRHRGERGWAWPVEPGTCGCYEAAQKQRRRFARKPAEKKARIARGRARSRALTRLRQMYPGIYNKMYAELLEGGGTPNPPDEPVWDELISRLVKAATGDTEDSIAQRMRLRTASRSEAEVLRCAQRVRALLQYLTEKPEDEDG